MNINLHFYSVGHGDHCLIQLPMNRWGIVDSHFDERFGFSSYPPGLHTLENERRSGRPVTIAFILLTHYDTDHVKGLSSLLDWLDEHSIKVENIILPGSLSVLSQSASFTKRHRKAARNEPTASALSRSEQFSQTPRRLLRFIDHRLHRIVHDAPFHYDASSASDMQVAFVHVGDSVTYANFGANSDLDIDILAPFRSDIDAYLSDRNVAALSSAISPSSRIRSLSDNNSISILARFSWGKNDVLLGGDAHIDVWDRSKAILTTAHSDRNLECRLVKVSHHGSSYSSSEELWSKVLCTVSKTIAVVSAAPATRHPNPQTISHIKSGATSERKVVLLCTSHLEDWPSKSVSFLVPRPSDEFFMRQDEQRRKTEDTYRNDLNYREQLHSRFAGYCVELSFTTTVEENHLEAVFI